MYKLLNDDECKDIIIKFNNGINRNKLSKEYGVVHRTISNIIQRNGKIRIKPNSKYSVNEKFFNSIDSEEKAYWLGFLYADGYVIDKKHKFYSGLGIKDLDHLVKYNKSIESNYPIKRKESKKYNYFYVEITNMKYTQNLVDRGCVPIKTHKIEFPLLEKKLIRHFIRGFFDGDGSISCTQNIAQFSICCAVEDFLKKLVDEMSKDISLNRTLKLYRRKNGLFIFINTSLDDIVKIGSYLYDDSYLYLDRKKEYFDYIKNNKNEIRKTIEKNRYRKRKKKNRDDK